MADVQLRSLRVSADFDADSYVAGMNAKVAADKAGAASSVAVGNSVQQTDVKISRSGDALARLSRSYIDGFSNAERFNGAVNTLIRSIESGNSGALARASVIYDGLIKKYGLIADASSIAARGQRELAATIAATNARVQASPNLPHINDNNAQFRRANIGYQAFDIGQGLASGMPLPMILAQQGPQIAQIYAMEGGAKALAADFAAARAGLVGMLAAIGPIGIAFGAVSLAAGAFYLLTRTQSKTTDEVLKEHADNIKAVGDAYAVAEEKAKSYSLTDKTIADAALRTSTQELAEKQKQSIEDLRNQFGQTVAINRGAPVFTLSANLKPFQSAFDELKRSANVPEFINNIKAIGESQGITTFGDKVLAAAKQLGLVNEELEKAARLIRQIDEDRGPTGFLRAQGPTNRDDMGNLAAFEAQQKVAADRAEQALRAQIASITARSPQEKAAAARDQAAAQYNNDETPAARAQRIELAGTQALIAAQHELRQAKEDRQRQSQAELDAAQNELSLIGKTVSEQNRLRAEYQATAAIKQAAARAGVEADQKEIEAARQKAAQIAQINSQVALGKMVEDQGYDAQRLQLEANLIGATAEQRARATAALEAEIRLKQQGIEVSTQAAQGYIAEQEALAKSRVEIERQNAAYQSLQQAQGSVIDALVTGTGTMKDRLKGAADAALQWLQQMGANSIKNGLTGTNLPTLADLFSGKPQVPGATATSTAMMNVTASVVNLNGGVPGAGGLAGLLGFNPANNNVPPVGSAPLIPVERLPLPSVVNRQDGYVPPYDVAALANAGTTKTGIPLSTVTAGGLSAPVNSQYAGNFQAFLNDLQSQGYNVNSLGGYSYRNIAGTDKLSNHAFGNAIDINPLQNPVTYPGKGQGIISDLPPGIQDTAAKYGLEQGIWKSKYDPMHFEVAKGAQPMPLDQANQNMTKFSSSLVSTSKDVTNLGSTSTDTGKSIMDAFGANSPLAKPPASPGGLFPQAPTTLPSNYFPPAPTTGGGFNPFSIFTSLFSLFGFANGTDFAPGGPAWVGERGPEIVNLPRGSQVVPNHKLQSANQNNRSVNMKHEYNIVVSGNGDKELMSRMQEAAEESVRVGLDTYNREVLFKRIDEYQSDPYARGS